MFSVLGCALTAGFRTTGGQLAANRTARERSSSSGPVSSRRSSRASSRRTPSNGTVLKGYIDVEDPAEPAPATLGDSIERLGGVGDFQAACRQHDVERVVIAFSSLQHESLLDVVRIATSLRLKISIVPRLFEVRSAIASSSISSRA